MRTALSLAILPAAALLLAASSAGPVLSVRAGSRVWVEGTSTVRSYRCESTAVQGRATPVTEAASLAGLANGVNGAEVSLAVSGLDCRNGTMNGHMRRALKADQAPTLRFRPTTVRVTPSGDAQGDVTMTGPLTIAGQEQTVTFQGTVARDASGALRVSGARQIDMTQWGVQPPSLMMGTMKVNKLATIHFDVVLGS